ncbi:acyl CoA binding protein-domain-containing protein [Lyophyllum atratum]|nr:acyl CoA binding protein-domain-containing protein [Lyophyllum atratum]
MHVHSPSSQFHAAASYLSTAPSQVSTTTKLELYGLFKHVTVSPMPSSSRPSIFDMTGRAKWDAWSSAGEKYTTGQEAEYRYLEIARSLGWTEKTVIEQQPRPEQSDLGNIWDDESQPRSGGASGGMGGSVSTMTPLLEEADTSIHGMAVSDDFKSLSELLEKHPETDVNGHDEFGYTPLHLACDRGNLPVVKLLLSKGANPNIKDPDGLSASELARIAGHEAVQECLQSQGS